MLLILFKDYHTVILIFIIILIIIQYLSLFVNTFLCNFRNKIIVSQDKTDKMSNCASCNMAN